MDALLTRSAELPCRPGLGLSFYDDGFAIAYPKEKRKAAGEAISVVTEFIVAEGAEAQLQQLDQLASKLRLRGLPTTIVIRPGSYQLLQVPTPQVDESEMDAALRWKVKDLVVGLDVERSTVRSYPMPGQKGAAAQLTFAVVADTAMLQRDAEIANDAGLRVESIVTTELSLRSLFAAQLNPAEPYLLMMLFQQKSYLIHMLDGEIYRIRELNSGEEHLPGSGSGEEDRTWPERLVDEVSRFFIFCEHNCKGGRAQHLLVPEFIASMPKVMDALEDNIGLKPERFTLCPMDSRCLTVFGIACGEEEPLV